MIIKKVNTAQSSVRSLRRQDDFSYDNTKSKNRFFYDGQEPRKQGYSARKTDCVTCSAVTRWQTEPLSEFLIKTQSELITTIVYCLIIMINI